MQMLYWDAYKRVDGIWYFQKRLPMYWYASDLNKPPLGSKKMRWPDQEAYEGYFHDLFPTWKELNLFLNVFQMFKRLVVF